MQGKIKNFRHFIYRKNPNKAIISGLQVKIPHIHILTHYKDELFGFTRRNPQMLNFTANKQKSI